MSSKRLRVQGQPASSISHNPEPWEIAAPLTGAATLEAVLENSERLTAEEIGERGKFSPSSLAGPANQWKQEGKIFAILYQGQDRFPRYELDEAFRPLPALESVLKLFGPISPWHIAGLVRVQQGLAR